VAGFRGEWMGAMLLLEQFAGDLRVKGVAGLGLGLQVGYGLADAVGEGAIDVVSVAA
jgi:hypothetical protein